jgi:hypothetical protein
MRKLSVILMLCWLLPAFSATFSVDQLKQFYGEGRKLFSEKAYFWIMEMDEEFARIEGVGSYDGINFEINEHIEMENLAEMVSKVEAKADAQIVKAFNYYLDKESQLITETGRYKVEAVHGQRVLIHGVTMSDGIYFEVHDWVSMLTLYDEIVEVK